MITQTRNAVAGALFLTCLAAFPFASVAAEAWKAELVAGAEVRAPSDPIRVRLEGASFETLQRIALELDNFDVTQIAAFDNGVLTVMPPQPLQYGEHRLRLLEHAPDGKVIEHGSWPLAVRRSAAFRESELQGNVWLEGSLRLADKDLSRPEPDRFNINAGAQLQGMVADGNWRATGAADLIYNRDDALMPRGEGRGHVDLGQFLFTAQRGVFTARAGHFSASPESLVMQGFSRRGVSLGADLGHTAVTAFSQRTQEVIGLQNGLGVGDSANRTDGLALSARPLGAQSEALLLTATYVDGEGPEQTGAPGSGVAGDGTRTRGSAFSVSADSFLLERRLRLRGEFARSDFDFDADGTDVDNDGLIDQDLDAEQDRAHTLMLGYTPWRDLALAGQPLAWNLGLEQKRLGTYFRSPANPAGLSDREGLRGYTDVNWSGLFVSASFGRDTDNVNDIGTRPRIELSETALSATYTPTSDRVADPQGQLPVLPWYGQPSYTVAYVSVDQDVDKAGAGLSTGRFKTTSTVSFSASFGYTDWNWSLSHAISENDDLTDQSADTRNNATQINASLSLGERLSLAPSLQRSRTEERNAPVAGAGDVTAWTGGLNLGYRFSAAINGQIQFNYNRNDGDIQAQDSTSRDLNGAVSWALRQAQGMRPGMKLTLAGQYHNADGQAAALAGDNYQVFLKFGLGWQPRL